MSAQYLQNTQAGEPVDGVDEKDAAESRDSGRGPVTTGPLTGRQPMTGSMKSGKKSSTAFRTISEVADALDVQQHVLRFWETKFSQVRPLKRGGGRRYYRPEDVALLKKIHCLLYTEGYTIKGVQKLLKEQGRAGVLASGGVAAPAETSAARPAQEQEKQPNDSGLTPAQKNILGSVLEELKDLRKLIKPE